MARRPEAGGAGRGALALRALLALALCAPGAGGQALEWYSAVVSLQYVDRHTNRTLCSVSESSRFGDSSPKEGALGLVGVPRAADGDPAGCAPGTRFVVPAPGGRAAAPWVTLVARGGCAFKDQVLAAARSNASAVVIYNEERHGNLTGPLAHAGTGNIVVIMVSYSKGKEILDLVQKEIQVKMTIRVGTRHVQEFISGQSVVFVAIAFITMMIISLAWLIFYYIQRFLYTGSQLGSQSHRKETKKVIGQLPLHTIKHGEKGLDVDAENCAVCIENFKAKDVIRILPCRHIFHRVCIDPWLSDHHTCPMCKLDVIKALGYWGEPEDAPEAPTAEAAPGGAVAAGVSVTVGAEDRSAGCPAPSARDPAPPCRGRPKDDAGESTALLETAGATLRVEDPSPHSASDSARRVEL
ncbi:E3 ubiquitin-protein ligase RNF149 isoform X1 [Pipistrellus kuhlii]|uniref:E3 ubiquitin-protein ligase RNF149 isoform X1 n=1 Tax=Pipistrellus kuhlii TaxID=59472 RepID=UPI001E274C21|nr:E3 ubiquitin-protein ligase RNF149 isoform X1 [Pipistrellus kuhlii]